MGLGFISAVEVTGDSNHSGVQHLAGWSFRETAASAAEVRLRNGAVGGDILAVFNLPADGSVESTPLAPIRAPSGVFVEVVGGTVEGVLYAA